MGQCIGQCQCWDALLLGPLQATRARKELGDACSSQAVPRALSERWDCKQFLTEKTGRANDFYKRIGDLGEGAFGDVWLARQRICAGTEQEREGRLVAIKRVRKVGAFQSDEARAGAAGNTSMTMEDVLDFRTEVDLMKSLDHPSICRLLQVFEDVKNLYIVMEYIKGSELFDRIADYGSFCEADAADVMNQVASALFYCHQHGVVHRDIKPENIMVVDSEEDRLSPMPESPSDDGPRVMVKVIDFGFGCRILQGAKLKAKVGSLVYTAPEVFKDEPCDEKQDIWSLGCVLYVLLSGGLPFDGPGSRKAIVEGRYSLAGGEWNGVSAEAVDLVKLLLTALPQGRPSAGQVLEHPWLKHCGEVASHRTHQRTKPLKQLDALRTFHEQNTFRHLCAGVIARQLDEALLHKLHCAFCEMDENEDGIISMSELKRACQQLGPEGNKIFFAVDMDGSGYIDYTEFIAACVDHKIEDQEGVCWAAFQVFDKNGDGSVSFDELRDVLNSANMQSRFSPTTLRQLWRQLTGVENLDGTPPTPDERVDFDDFVAALHGVRATARESLLRASSTPFSKLSGHSFSPWATSTRSAPARSMASPNWSPAPSPAVERSAAVAAEAHKKQQMSAALPGLGVDCRSHVLSLIVP